MEKDFLWPGDMPMISLPENIDVLVAADFVGMRKQIDGLCILVCNALKQQPQSQTVFVFYNRSRDKVKLLVWDRKILAFIRRNYK